MEWLLLVGHQLQMPVELLARQERQPCLVPVPQVGAGQAADLQVLRAHRVVLMVVRLALVTKSAELEAQAAAVLIQLLMAVRLQHQHSEQQPVEVEVEHITPQLIHPQPVLLGH